MFTPVINRRFFMTASAEIAPCDIIIAPLLGRARGFGDAIARGADLSVRLRSQNRDFFTPRGEKSVANHTKHCNNGNSSAISAELTSRYERRSPHDTHPPHKTPHGTRPPSTPRGGVCRAAVTAPASNNKKNNLTSRHRAANTQLHQPLPVVGLMRALTGTPDTS